VRSKGLQLRLQIGKRLSRIICFFEVAFLASYAQLSDHSDERPVNQVPTRREKAIKTLSRTWNILGKVK
jgi:hypothetical protein